MDKHPKIIKCNHLTNEWGTFAAIACVQEGRKTVTYAITTYHTVAADLIDLGIYNYRPQKYKRTVSILGNHGVQNPLGFVEKGLFNRQFDVALIRLDKAELDNIPVRNTGYISISGCERYVGSSITIHSISNGIITGTLIAANSTQTANYKGRDYIKTGLLQIDAACKPGDSGAPVFIDNKLAAMVIGGKGSITYATPIGTIFGYFNLQPLSYSIEIE